MVNCDKCEWVKRCSHQHRENKCYDRFFTPKKEKKDMTDILKSVYDEGGR